MAMFWRKKKDKTEDAEAQALPQEAAEAPPVAPEPQALLKPEPAPIIPEATKAAPEPEPAPLAASENTEDEKEGGWLTRLSQGLSKSSNKITQGLTDVLTKRKLDQDMLDELEDVLIMADLGPRTAAKIVEEFSRDRFGKDISEEEIKEALAETIAGILEPVAKPLTYSKENDAGPFVVLMCGVNGAGKTTTIGKIAYDLHIKNGRSVAMAAGDTFRAAALEQLQVWADRARAPLIKKELGSDAASVAYEAYQQAQAKNSDVLLIDTAGRLQNKANLMDELQKIVRVLKKQNEALPHAVLLVLDATTGQNAFEQVRIFKEIVNVTGLIVTKLDGSAKGGVVVGLADQFGLPIHMVGVGEKIEDLQLFNPRDFARSLVGLSQ